MSNNQKDSFYGYKFNKLGNSPQKDSFKTLDTFGAEKAFPNMPVNLRTNACYKYKLFYCPNCGNAVYGDWKYYSYDFHQVTWGTDVDKYNTMFQKIVNKGNNKNKAVLQEIDSFKKSAICPCCNNLLNYSNGYFYDGSDYEYDFKDIDCKEKLLKAYSKMEAKRKEIYKEQFEDVKLEDFYLYINKVEASLIRTEADELTYPIHVMLRYELEKQLIDGTLEVKDLEKAWNNKIKQYFDIEVPCSSKGVLQDSHWSGGSIGYFPTYALGSAIASQLYYKMNEEKF